MNIREFDYLYGDDLKQSALYKEAKLKSDELIQTIEQLNMDSTSEDDDIAVEGTDATQFNPRNSPRKYNFLLFLKKAILQKLMMIRQRKVIKTI